MDIKALLERTMGKDETDFTDTDKIELMGAALSILIKKDEAAEGKWKAISELIGILKGGLTAIRNELKENKVLIKQLENRVEQLEIDGA